MAGAAIGRRRGTVFLYIILCLVVMIGFVSFAVDWSLVAIAKSELHAAVDAAGLAGASGLPISPAEARSRAKDYALRNKINGQPLVLLDSDIELGTWNPTSRQFVVLTGPDENKA